MKKIVIIYLLLTYSLFSQVLPTLSFDKIDKPSEINSLDINVDVTGNIATTTIDILFYNPNNRVLKGDFKFPLNSNQKILDFYLEIDGKLRKASVIEKEKARVAFEATVRGNIDPGLVEKRADNSYRTQIFPIPAMGYKRVVIKVQEILTLYNSEYLYKLPLEYNSIPEFSFKIEVLSNGPIPKVSDSNLLFSQWENKFIMVFNQKNFKVENEISIFIPKEEINTWSENSYFYSTLDLSELYIEKGIVENKKEVINILWDTSSSRYYKNLDSEINYLESYVNKLHKDSIIYFIPFNISASETEVFKQNEFSKIKSYINNLIYDGGTTFNNLELEKYTVGKLLIFSDGVTNFEKGSNFELPSIPVDTITSNYKSNFSLLRHLSISTGGNFVNLLEGEIALKQPKLIKTQGVGIYEIYNDLEVGKEFHFVGKYSEDIGEVVFTFIDINNKEVIKRVKLLNNSDELNFDLPRLWAGKKIENLELNYDNNKNLITNLGKEYSLITRNTSLIVLDRIEDYIRFNIKPPAELLPLWYKDKNRLEESENNQLSEALEEMSILKGWWETDFPKVRIKKYKESDKLEQSYGDIQELSEEPQPRMEMEMEDSFSESNPLAKKSDSLAPDPNAITVEAWTPDEPYMKVIQQANVKDLYLTYYKLKETYKNMPSFYLDMATLFYDKGYNKEALLILSNILELGVEEPELIRITSYLLEKFSYNKEALEIAYKLLDIRPEEPQTYRDIANLSLLNNVYQDALNYYYKVLNGTWDGRFKGVKSVVLNEMNYLIHNFKEYLDISEINKKLIFKMDLDVRAVISWSSDNNDIDLWVKDPYEEDCSYSNKLTYTGGKLSSDFTGGYGPEEFSIKEKLSGDYGVTIKFYSDNRPSITGPITIKVDLYKDYGTSVNKTTIIRRLKDVNEELFIGSIK